MEISGTVISVLPTKTGKKTNGGEWKKQVYVLKTNGEYPKHICFEVWNDKITQFNIEKNDFVVASINIESTEFNDRWYTNIKAWKVIKKQEKKPQPVELDDEIPF